MAECIILQNDLEEMKQILRDMLTDGKCRHRDQLVACLLYTSPSPRDKRQSRMPSSA